MSDPRPQSPPGPPRQRGSADDLTPERPRSATHLRAVATAVFVTVLWSSSWVLIRIGLDDEDLEPLTFAGLRYALAALVLGTLVAASSPRRSEARSLDASTRRRLVVLGLVFVTVTQGAQFVAIDSQPASTTSLMLAPTALGVAIVSSRLIGESVRPWQVVGTLMIVVGAAIYFAGDLGATTVGMIAATVGLLANVAGALLGRSVNRTGALSPVVVTATSMAVGSSVLLTIGVAVEGWPTLTFRSAVILAWLAVVNTAAAFTLWNRSLRELSALESATINNTMLIQIALLAWVFLGEAPGLIGGLGILIVSAGAFVATSPRRSAT